MNKYYFGAGGSFKDLATCRMPPPCMEGYSQFRMPGTDSMCCRKSKGAKKSRPCKCAPGYVKPCPHGKVKCPITGKCIKKKNEDLCGAKRVVKYIGPDGTEIRRAKTGGANMKAAKDLLRSNYKAEVKGVMRSPPFISTLKGVTGKTSADKIANLRRVLSTCKASGIPLVKKSGSGFKAYRTLVTQCGVRMTKGNEKYAVFNRGPMTEKRASSLIAPGLARLRARIAERKKTESPYAGDEISDYNAELGPDWMLFGRRRARFGANRIGSTRFGNNRLGMYY